MADPVMVRQGDVLLVPVAAIPGAATPVPRDGGRVVLAYGEVTGHAHAIDSQAARQVEAADGRYLEVAEPATLAHEEHAAIAVAPGTYRIVIQREYTPPDLTLADGRDWRRVAD